MLKVVRDERSFIVESDDKNAENMALEDAVVMAAPHLASDFGATPLEDGWLRWRVQREEWQSLVEVLEALEFDGGINPDEVEAALGEIEAAIKEPV